MRFIVFCLLLLPLLFLGCGAPITSGEVLDKYLVPEHEEDEPDITIGDDPPITIPGGTYTVPDQWFVVIGKSDEDGRYKKRTIQVTQDLHDSLDKGDWYAIPQKE